jgi:exonuclease VII small subunit
MAEQQPYDEVLIDDNASSQKRQREDDEDSSKRPTKRSISTLQARRIINEVVSKRSSAREALETAKTQLRSSQQYFEEAQRELQQAEQAVSETSQQLCDELLQEDNAWNAMYKVLLNFHEKHGHTRVPRNPSREQKEADPNLSKLGGWVGRQRRDYRRPLDDDGRLEEYQIIALERVNFDFDPHKTVWMKRYGEIKEFKATHGHFDVPMKKAGLKNSPSDNSDSNSSLEDSIITSTSDGSEATDYSALASWVKRQQYQYKLFRDGNPASEMTEERIGLLEEIGFPWSKRAEQWMERYNALKEYKQKNGDTQPPNTKEFRILSEWTKDQRRQFKRYQEDPSTSNLSEEQMTLLRELPLDLDLRAASWSTQFQQLMDFKKQHGHCVLPSKYPLNQKLASWVATQRRQYQLMIDEKPSQLT